ncbi:DapH/DapD/GlmU-related protein [Pseudoalteromonas sp. SG44-17]|uniref:acyltransferase n=1 Tax=Pseudoalteromonas sp. SG44-17 TaxID=2760963 RepID=UPI0016047E58|nr:DapH/DapD/GlmU-related protein [Pseudoalteromonas sp. SG44-17]MBB1411678.1 acyltransferase [Pseudoalteromonas sp. SG44-17]
MMKLKRVICFFLMSLIPSTRLYAFKAFILNIIGFNISNTARIVSSVKILGLNNIHIGSDTFIGHETLIIGSNNTTVVIEENCDISSRVTIITGTHEIDISGDRVAGKGYGQDIKICRGVWIGVNATILPGVIVGEMSIVAAGSVVTKNVPPNVIVAGVPAKIIRTLI